MRRRDRQRDQALAIALVEVGREATGFAPEDQHDIGRAAEGRVPHHARPLCREEVRLAERRQFPLEGRPVIPHPQVDVFPVVQARTPYLAVVEREAERLDEMQRSARGQAGPTGVPGVPVNLRVDEDDVGRRSDGISIREVSNQGRRTRRC